MNAGGRHYLIVGNSASGIAAAQAICKSDKKGSITIISDEDYPSYCRCLISYYLAGDIREEDILYRSAKFYKENNIEVALNKKAIRVDPGKRTLYCEDKTTYEFDSLLIATGASSKMPKIKGIDTKGVFGFRTIQDAKRIDAIIARTKTACISGGGLVGLKCAYALKKRGLDTKVIVKSGQVLSQVLDKDPAGLVQKHLQSHGIEFIFGHDVAEVSGDGYMKALTLDSGKSIEASLLIVSKGVAPNVGVLAGSGVKVNEGVTVDDTLRTSAASIYAAGDVCETYDITLSAPAVNALWPVAVWQGRVAGTNMAGGDLKYKGSFGMNSLEFFGFPTISLGMFNVKAGSGLEEIKLMNAKNDTYKKFVIKDNSLVGAVLAGKVANAGVYMSLIDKGVDITPFRDRLTEDNFSYPDIIDYIKDEETRYV